MVKNELVFKKRYKIVKYGLLALFGILAIYKVSPIRIGDYCLILGNIIELLVFVGLFLFVFFIFLILDLVRNIKYKIKFDYIPCVCLVVFAGICFLSFQIENEKFWTKEILIGQVELDSDLFSAEQLILYENKTFSIKSPNILGSCTYQGKYAINQDTLILKRNNLPELTNKLFCIKYLIQQSDSVLIPIDKDYKIINFRKYENRLCQIAN